MDAIEQEIRAKAEEVLWRAKAALLDAKLEVEKWEKFLHEYSRPHD